ncbi:uncharacterized protein LOC124930141 [Impatiens glandulifera]|uniref:uncharacterized protein LOC124930141 n=1 Tax=Impatiens glandulifera TaxID=253017 RepID=UPI001FB1169A|nr:uncharacterized protein LOC124930141 [Impatiens glandulifera]
MAQNNAYSLQHISIIKLDQKSFVLWRSQVVPALKGYGFFGFVNGEISQLLLKSKKHRLPLSFRLGNNKINVAGENCISSQYLWETLERRFATQSKARLMQLRLQLQTIKKEESFMESYLQAIKVITDNLAAAGQQVADEDLILYVLGGLGPEYESLLVVVTTRPDSINVDDFSGLLLTHEIRLESLYANSPTANVVYSRRGTSATMNHTDKGVFSPSFGSATRPSTPGASFHSQQSASTTSSILGQPSNFFNSRTGPSRPHRPYRGPQNQNRPKCQTCGRFGHL